MTERTTPIRLAAWLALWLLTLYLVFLGGGWAGLYSTEVRTASLVLIGAGLAVWGIAAIARPAWVPASQLVSAFAVSLGAFAIGLATSRAPRVGVEYLGYSILLTALYLLLVRLLAHAWFRPRFMGIVVTVAILQGFAYLVETVSSWMAWWQLVGRVTTPPLRPGFGSLLLGNPSAVMTVEVLLAIASVAWLGFGSPGRRVASVTITALAIATTVISGSRSGWLALAGALGITFLIWIASPERRRWAAERLRSRAARGAVLTGVVGAAGLALVLAPGVLVRATLGGETYRLANYAAALRMFGDAPLTGTGPGTWVSQRIAYTLPSEPDYYIPYAHNLPLQTAAEFGLLGLAAGAVVVVLVGRLIWRGLRDDDPVRRRMGWAALLGTLYFVGHQQLDFYGSSPVALFAFSIPIAFLDATAGGRRTTPRSRVAAAMLAVLVGVSLAGLLLAESVAGTMSRAVVLADQGRWTDAVGPAREAAARDPDLPPYQFALATIARHAGDSEAALAAYRRSAEADSLPVSWLGVAVGELEAGRGSDARAAVAEALRVGFQQTAVLVAAGDVYLRLGDDQEATECFARAVAAVPSLAADQRWRDDPRLAPIFPAVVEQARDRTSDIGRIELQLAIGDLDAAARAAAALPEPSATRLSLVVRAWQGDPTAVTALAEAARARPLDIDGLLWAARAAAHHGNAELARELRSAADTVNGLSSIGSYETRFAPDGIPANEVAGLAGRLYGHYTYRRPTPFDQIPAGLLHLELE